MAIQNSPDNQKVDYLWKKLGYGVAKTDIAGNIDATQEPYASPLLIRSDTMWQQSGSIPSVLPASNSSVVTVYPTTFPIQCTNDAGIPTPQLTWVTGVTNWIPPEFGSTYQVKVYIAPAGQAANVTTKGTQVFATGSGNNDEWFFDYKAGILNFNSNNTPYSGGSPISFTGNAVYISGGVYSGAFGLPAAVSTGNITFSNTTISTSWSSANIVIAPTGTGIVQMYGNTALYLPTGNTATRPTNPLAGYIRFNSDTNNFEYFDGTNWDVPGAATITSATINPDGTSNTYSLGYTTTSAGIIVSINGTLQQPGNAYNVTGNSITFTETPLTTDTIEVRKISAGITSVTSLQYGPTNSVTLDGANVTIQGNVLPSANITYDIGSPTQRWRTGYFSANTIDLGGSTISVTAAGFSFNSAGTITTIASNGSISSNTLTAPTTTVTGNLTVIGNVSAPYFIGSGALLTALPGYAYGNTNVAAYLNTQGYNLYSNVNVASYLNTQGYNLYSNVNVIAYLGTNSVTIGSNLLVQGSLTVIGNTSLLNIEYVNVTEYANSIQAGNISAVTFGNIGAVFTGTSFNASGNVLASRGSFGNLNSSGAQITGVNTFTPAGNANVNLGSISNQWATIYGTATTAQYADLAENYVADFDYVPGTVVDFGGDYEVTVSSTDMSAAVAGVVSENPAYLMNSTQRGTYVVAVALQGRVKTNVTGVIRKGNMLVSAGNGMARAETNPLIGTVIGKALEDFNGTQGLIEIVVGVR
jgi:hypothetical protein